MWFCIKFCTNECIFTALSHFKWKCVEVRNIPYYCLFLKFYSKLFSVLDGSDDESPRETNNGILNQVSRSEQQSKEVTEDEEERDDNDEERDVEKSLTPKKKGGGDEKSKPTMLRPQLTELDEEDHGDKSVEPQANNPLLLKKLNTQVGWLNIK